MRYTKGPWYPVEYVGYWFLQKSPEYSATDSLLDEEKCTYAETNAKVAAAAPDMLAALQNLENDDKKIPEHAWALIQSAIKKATE